MISITSYVTFVKANEEGSGIAITGGERYHTHTHALHNILELVDKDIHLAIYFIPQESGDSEGRVQFKIYNNNDPIKTGGHAELKAYKDFSKKLKSLLKNTEIFHDLVNKDEREDAIELNQQFDYNLEKVARELYKIERDVELVFHTGKLNPIANISAVKLSRLHVLTEIKKHERKNILIDQWTKHNTKDIVTFSLKDADTLKLLGSQITIKEELITAAHDAYLNSTPVDITVMNNDKVAPNNCKLSGKIVKIEESQILS